MVCELKYNVMGCYRFDIGKMRPRTEEQSECLKKHLNKNEWDDEQDTQRKAVRLFDIKNARRKKWIFFFCKESFEPRAEWTKQKNENEEENDRKTHNNHSIKYTHVFIEFQMMTIINTLLFFIFEEFFFFRFVHLS